MEAETIQTTRTLPGENKNNKNDDSDAPRSGGGVVVSTTRATTTTTTARIGHERRSSVHSFHRTVGTQGNGDYSFSFHHLGDALLRPRGRFVTEREPK